MPEEEIVNGLIAAVTKTFNGQLRLLANKSLFVYVRNVGTN